MLINLDVIETCGQINKPVQIITVKFVKYFGYEIMELGDSLNLLILLKIFLLFYNKSKLSKHINIFINQNKVYKYFIKNMN